MKRYYIRFRYTSPYSHFPTEYSNGAFVTLNETACKDSIDDAMCHLTFDATSEDQSHYTYDLLSISYLGDV